MAPDIIERWKASAQHQLCLALLPITHARSESINADHSGQFTHGGYLSTVIHTTSAGLEPTTSRLLICWSDALPVAYRTSNSAIDSPNYTKST